MIVRLVLAAAVTAAVLAASMPALTTARIDRTDATIERQLRGLATRLQTFVAANDPTATASARRIETIRLPTETMTSAGVEYVQFQGEADNGSVSWQVGDGTRSKQRLVDVTLRPTDGSLTLRDPGPHRLVFGLQLRNGTNAVTVSRQPSASAGGHTDA